MNEKVVFVSPDNAGCKWYRGWMPYKFVNDIRPNTCFITNSVHQYEWFGNPKLVHGMGFQRPVTKDIANLVKAFAQISYVDIDDNFFDLKNHPGNPCHYDLIRSAKELGYDPIHDAHKDALIAAEIVTVSTKPMGDAVARHTGRTQNIVHIPNGFYNMFSETVVDNALRDRVGKLRIGWWGGHHHNEDFQINGLATKLRDFIMEVRDMVDFTFLGWAPLEVLETGVVNFLPWVDVTSFYEHLFNLKIDICIGPITTNLFSDCKSNIKFLESAMYKRPFVTMDSPIWEGLTHRDTAMIAPENDSDTFIQHIDELVRDAELRRTIGANAYAYAQEHYHMNKIAPKWLEVFEHLFQRAHKMDKWYKDDAMMDYHEKYRKELKADEIYQIMTSRPISDDVFNSVIVSEGPEK